MRYGTQEQERGIRGADFSLNLCPQRYFLRTRASPIQRSFQGCMQLIQVDDQLADLTAVEQGRMGAFENVSLDMCAIIDRSEPTLLALPCLSTNTG
ncbi:Contactin-associated protein-like 2 [Anabarilius grahami]|uniref:Contactin-associated protein-like 2 n=1 Tax=Anabarilius grahami TaxID=495550 RepID=A0A3N0XX66_ANAGA|nr:Contactin-associated protein-like 2 [Anabarilius grahami]